MRSTIVSALFLCCALSLPAADRLMLSKALGMLEYRYGVGFKPLVAEVPVYPPPVGEDIQLENALVEFCTRNGYRYRMDLREDKEHYDVVIALQKRVMLKTGEVPVVEVLAAIGDQMGRSGEFFAGYNPPDMKVAVEWNGVLLSQALEELATLTGGRVLPLRRYSDDILADLSWGIVW